MCVWAKEQESHSFYYVTVSTTVIENPPLIAVSMNLFVASDIIMGTKLHVCSMAGDWTGFGFIKRNWWKSPDTILQLTAFDIFFFLKIRS